MPVTWPELLSFATAVAPDPLPSAEAMYTSGVTPKVPIGEANLIAFTPLPVLGDKSGWLIVTAWPPSLIVVFCQRYALPWAPRFMKSDCGPAPL